MTTLKIRGLSREAVAPEHPELATVVGDAETNDTTGTSFVLDTEFVRAVASAREHEVQRELTARRHLHAMTEAKAAHAHLSAAHERPSAHERRTAVPRAHPAQS